MTPVLETAGLGKDYGAIRAVGALDLQVGEGEIFGLLGPNGAGKTTAISMMAGVVTPSRGSTRVCGHDMGREPFRAKRCLGLVPQELALYEEITAIDNLRFFGSLYGLEGKKLSERIDWALDLAGLADRAREPVTRFSGGMKRRLNLVASLLHQPRVVILDEPTVGVDPQSRNYLFEAIRELARSGGMTVVYTSHYMEEVQALCDRVAIVDHGALVAQGTVDELIRQHGSGALEIRFSGDASAVLAAAAAHGDARGDGDRVRVVPSAGISPVLAAIEATGAEIQALRSLDDDLETVFLALTGHSLRDEA